MTQLAPIEALPERRPYIEYEYARSPAALLKLGSVAVEGANVSFADQRAAHEQAFQDLTSALAENLGTMKDVASGVDIERAKSFPICDGQAIMADGTPIVDMVKRGLEVSQEAAKSDPRMQRQAVRDEGDVRTAEIVDSLGAHETYCVISMDPKEGLREDPEFWESLGYGEGHAYVQVYYKKDDGELIASSFSVGNSDTTLWRKILQRHGVNVPLDANCDEWIRHGIRKTTSQEEAGHMAAHLRDEYYSEKGRQYYRYSVTEFVQRHESIVRDYFERYMVPLAQAVYSGKNNPIMQSFAQELLQSPATADLKSEVRHELIRVANAEQFSEDSAIPMENLIRYALAMDLRSRLLGAVSSGPSSEVWQEGYAASGTMAQLDHTQLNVHISNLIRLGIQEGVIMKGCSGLQLLARQSYSANGRQEIYGGRSDEIGEIHYAICITPGCPSYPSVTEVGGCGVCLDKCQRLWDQGINPTSVYHVETHDNTVPIPDSRQGKDQESATHQTSGRDGNILAFVKRSGMFALAEPAA